MEDTGEESDDDNDVEEMLAKLNEITERFDALDESYQNALKSSEESRKVLVHVALREFDYHRVILIA